MPTSRATAQGSTSTHRGLPDDPLWYKDAVIYQVHVRGFFDSNEDGVGDFPGLTQRLDYIQSLGVSAIWLQPFYPSPLKDDGYDIAHYEGVHPHYGSRRDFAVFLEAAHERGLRVITELIINHTSDQHPWFQAARRAKPGTAKRNFYVWSDTDQKYAGVPIIFKDSERSNWTWDAVAHQFYWHRFFHHQPDLNFDHPSVQRAVLKVMRFWLDMGVDGMRLDAVPYLVEREGTQCTNLPETHAILKNIRRELDTHYRNRMLLAEANQWPSDVRAYFGDGDECHMAFHFPLMPRLYMALQQEDRHPLSQILHQMPDIPDSCQWALFLRNHDELTLEMVSDEERDYMYDAYGSDPQMRVNVGIRRRLAPLMENSRPRVELMHALLLSLPGTPVIYYGDELGMGDNIYLGDRNAVRTPMQWSSDRNGGFSRADPARLYAPAIMDPVYGFQSVNVEAQNRSPHSLLNWMRRLVALRQTHAGFGRGTMDLLRPTNRKVFAFIRRHAGTDPILVVANLSRTVQAVSLDLRRDAGLVPVEMTGGVGLPRITDAPYFFTLGPHAFYWLMLQRDPPTALNRPAITVDEPDPDQAPLLVGPEWGTLLEGSIRQLLETRYLVPFLRRQAWFEARQAPVAHVRITDWGAVERGDEPVLFVMLDVRFTDDHVAQYVVPLTVTPGEAGEDIARQAPELIVARVGGARQGVLHSQLERAAGRVFLQGVQQGRDVPLRHGRIRGIRGEAWESISVAERDGAPASASQENLRRHSTVVFGDQAVVKVVRRLWPGPSPERTLLDFLGSTGEFTRVPPMAGTVEYELGDTRGTVGLVTGIVSHQDDGWRNAIAELTRFLELPAARQTAPPSAGQLPSLWTADVPETVGQTVGTFLRVAHILGQRVAEMHLALSGERAERAFGRARLDAGGLDRIAERVLAIWERARVTLIECASSVETAQSLIDRQDAVRSTIESSRAAVAECNLQLTRIFSNLDLVHTLLHEGDVTFIGPADDWTVPAAVRSRLRSPLEDIASLLRSFFNAGELVIATHVAMPGAERDRLSGWTRWWVGWTAATFLRRYRATIGAAAFLPPDTTAVIALLRLFFLEQALDDLRFSATTRPGWVPIAVAGALHAAGDRTA